MKIIAYTRVSTDRQAEDGLGLDVQERACRAWARDNGHKIIRVESDEGVSGSNGIDGREALPRAMAALRDTEATGIVVYRLDRLARDLVLQEQLLAQIRRYGAEPFTTSAAEAGYLADDPQDPSRRLIRQVLGAVNEYERSMIALRLRSGKAAKHRQGRYAGYGSPAFGQQAISRELVPDAAEQKVIEVILDLHDQGHSTRVIASRLNAEGMASKRGGQWHAQTVARVIGRMQ